MLKKNLIFMLFRIFYVNFNFFSNFTLILVYFFGELPTIVGHRLPKFTVGK